MAARRWRRALPKAASASCNRCTAAGHSSRASSTWCGYSSYSGYGGYSDDRSWPFFQGLIDLFCGVVVVVVVEMRHLGGTWPQPLITGSFASHSPAIHLSSLSHSSPIHMWQVELELSKADPAVSGFYDAKLCTPELRAVGDTLRDALSGAIEAITAVAGHSELLENHPNTKQSFGLRRPYLLTLHAIQGEVMSRLRGGSAEDGAEATSVLTDAMTVTVQGIAAGMQNTG